MKKLHRKIRFFFKISYLIPKLLFFSACISESQDPKVRYYYDLQEALQALEKPQSTFLKTTTAEGKTQIKEVTNINWNKELAFFEQANLNKSAFRNSYQEKISREQDSIVISYVSQNDELKVRSLKIVLLQDSSLALVEAFIKTDNYLYSSEKYLKLLCKNKSIESYYIRGKQKMIFADPEHFEVKAERKTSTYQ